MPGGFRRGCARIRDAVIRIGLVRARGLWATLKNAVRSTEAKLGENKLWLEKD